jgi:hypothetical protein
MLLPSGGGGGDAAAAAVVPRLCIWSGMMIRTGALLAGWAGLRLKLLLGRQLDRQQSGRHATSHAGGEARVYIYINI